MVLAARWSSCPIARVMRLLTAPTKKRHARCGASAGFTLAEVLAALMFLAIVIPTAVEVLHIASLAGEVAARKSEAARMADRVLSESIVTTNWSGRPERHGHGRHLGFPLER